MKDYTVLKELGKKFAEVSNLPIQEEKRQLWTANNSLEKTRPLVNIDQLPWHEIRKSDEMALQCEDEFLRSVELEMKKTLYRFKHFACDMVVENRIDIPMAIHDFRYGIDIVEETLETDSENDIVSHAYSDQVKDEEALNMLRPDKIWVDRELDKQHLEICNEIFKDIIPVRLQGVDIHSGIWDRIAQMRPADAIIWDIIDKPDYTKKVVQKFVDLTMSTIDQCEELGLLDNEASYVHCTGAYNRELEAVKPGENPTAKNCWSFGMAQIFSTVSPTMHDEFEIELVKPLYERFGLMYYGCCEPLENIIPFVRKINNVRKISCSPWANIDASADQIGKDYVYSAKANPAFIANGVLDKDSVMQQINDVITATNRNETPVEIILKDISTVTNNLKVLDDWAKLIMNKVEK